MEVSRITTKANTEEANRTQDQGLVTHPPTNPNQSGAYQQSPQDQYSAYSAQRQMGGQVPGGGQMVGQMPGGGAMGAQIPGCGPMGGLQMSGGNVPSGAGQ